jgi:hypothetical protein
MCSSGVNIAKKFSLYSGMYSLAAHMFVITYNYDYYKIMKTTHTHVISLLQGQQQQQQNDQVFKIVEVCMHFYYFIKYSL